MHGKIEWNLWQTINAKLKFHQKHHFFHQKKNKIRVWKVGLCQLGNGYFQFYVHYVEEKKNWLRLIISLLKRYAYAMITTNATSDSFSLEIFAEYRKVKYICMSNVLTWMMNQGTFTIGFFYFVSWCIGLNPKNLIIIFPLRLFLL